MITERRDGQRGLWRCVVRACRGAGALGARAGVCPAGRGGRDGFPPHLSWVSVLLQHVVTEGGETGPPRKVWTLTNDIFFLEDQCSQGAVKMEGALP